MKHNEVKCYDHVRKIILKNIFVSHEIGRIVLKPEVVNQLEEFFRRNPDAKENETT